MEPRNLFLCKHFFSNLSVNIFSESFCQWSFKKNRHWYFLPCENSQSLQPSFERNVHRSELDSENFHRLRKSTAVLRSRRGRRCCRRRWNFASHGRTSKKEASKSQKEVFKEFCLIQLFFKCNQQNRNVFFCIMYSNSVSHKKKVSVSFVYLIKGQFFNNFKTRFTSLIYKDSCNFSLLFISSRT